MEKVDISIIIPVYNSEKYLEECLERALAQTIINKEILCVDDCSTDGSLAILEKFERKYKEVKIIRMESNQGSGAARNKGIHWAKGKYICFLDTDDFYLDDRSLEKLVESCEAHQVKVSGGFRKYKMEESKELDLIEAPLHRELCEGKPDGVMLDFWDLQNDFYYHSYIYERDLVLENKITFPDYRRYQDPPFFLRTMIAAKKMWILPVEFYCYRYGHQAYERNGKHIVHLLMGIRDNMKLSRENGLFILQEKMVERIKDLYYWDIMAHFDETVLNLLSDIQNEVADPGIKIEILSQLSDSFFMARKHWELWISFRIMSFCAEENYKNYDLSNYLCQQMGIRKLAIYGLGKFGELLYHRLKESKVTVAAGIDKEKKEFYDLNVVSDVDLLEDVDVIIVTPVKEQLEIVGELRRKTDIPVYSFLEIVERAEHNGH